MNRTRTKFGLRKYNLFNLLGLPIRVTYTGLPLDLEEMGYLVFLVPFEVISFGHITSFVNQAKIALTCTMTVFHAYQEKEWVTPTSVSLTCFELSTYWVPLCRRDMFRNRTIVLTGHHPTGSGDNSPHRAPPYRFWGQ